MAEQNVDSLEYNYAIESSLGTIPSSGWRGLAVNSVGRLDATRDTVEQDYISQERAPGPSAITSVDSKAEFETDLSRSTAADFLALFLMSAWKGGLVTRSTAAVDGGVSEDSFTVPSGGALAAGTLIRTRGFANPANNGVFVVQAGSTGTSILVPTGSLVAEAGPPSNAEVAVVGFEGTAGDLEIDADGNLISTTLNFLTSLPLTVGQAIKLPANGTTYAFFNAANTGYARISKIEANKLTLDKRGQAFVADDGTATGSGGAPKAIRFFFERFCRNVAGSHGDFLRQSITIEEVMGSIESSARYTYTRGLVGGVARIDMPLDTKATVNWDLTGIMTNTPTDTRATMGSGEPIQPNAHGMYGTMQNVHRLRLQEVDESGLTTDFKNAALVIDNRVATEDVIGQVEAKYIQHRKLEAVLEAEVIVTSEEMLSAIAEHRTVTADFVLANDQGAVLVDLPAVKLASDGLNRPRGEAVKMPIRARAFKDPILGYSVGISTFGYVE